MIGGRSIPSSTAANPKAVIAFSYGRNEQACVCEGIDDYTGGDTWSKQDLTRLTPEAPASSARRSLAWQDLLRQRLSRPGRCQPVQRSGTDRLDQHLQPPGWRLHARLAVGPQNRTAQGIRHRAVETGGSRREERLTRHASRRGRRRIRWWHHATLRLSQFCGRVLNIHELPKTHLVIRSLVLAVESDG